MALPLTSLTLPLALPHQDPAEKRHLLRLWLAVPPDQAWPLPEPYAEMYHTTQPGERGGIRIEGFNECIPLEAE